MAELYDSCILREFAKMTTLRASQTRIPPDAFNRVAYQGERVRIDRRGGKPVYLICEDQGRALVAGHRRQ